MEFYEVIDKRKASREWAGRNVDFEVIKNKNRKLNLAQKMYSYAMPGQYTMPKHFSYRVLI